MASSKATDLSSVLSPELAASVSGVGAGDVLVMPGSRKKKKKKQGKGQPAGATGASAGAGVGGASVHRSGKVVGRKGGEAPKLTRAQKRAIKSKERKLAKLQADKEAKAKREAVLASLASTSIDPKLQAVMRGSGSLGGKQTKRQRLWVEAATKDLMTTLNKSSKRRRGGGGGGGRAAPPSSTAATGVPSGSDLDSEFDDEEDDAEAVLSRPPPHATVAASVPSSQPSPPQPPASRPFAPTPSGAPLSSSSPSSASSASPSDSDDGGAAVELPLPPPRRAPMADAFVKKEKPLTSAELAEKYSKPEGERYVPVPLATKNLGKEAPEEMRARMKKWRRTRYVVTVDRLPEVEASRMELPVCQMEQEVMELVFKHPVVILCGETGSGKTTQVPQFLFEAGFGAHRRTPGVVAITQPRRVAAVAMAARVAKELNVKTGKKGLVGHQIRYDASNVGKSTRVKFMTDGILLREMQEDLLLTRYSMIILDEAHERNLNTDILLGLLSRALPYRNKLATEAAAKAPKGTVPSILPLHMIIMSATLKVEEFASNKRLFPDPPPVLHVSGRQFPVTKHFSKRTELSDYVGAAMKKVVAIHERLPDGGVLVFLTGEQEVRDLVRRLRRKFSSRRRRRPRGPDARMLAAAESGDNNDDNASISSHSSASSSDGTADDSSAGDVDDVALSDDDSDDDDASSDSSDDSGSGSNGADASDGGKPTAVVGGDDNDDADADADVLPPVHVLPLFAMLPRHEQARVFEPPPEGHRLVVVATNVAETSVTLPGIKYVVDCGRVKRKVYNMRSGAATFEVGWISQASAEQRAGRAGRVGPGHCYRLYSSAVFSRFLLFDDPEVLRMPLDSMVLQLKAVGINNVLRFPFVSPPSRQSLDAAVRSLLSLGALEVVRVKATAAAIAGTEAAGAGAGAGAGGADAAEEDDGAVDLTSPFIEERLTALGSAMSAFPVSPAFAKMLLMGQAQLAKSPERLNYVVAVVAAMSVLSPLIRPSFKKPVLSGDKGSDTKAGDAGSDGDDGEGDNDDDDDDSDNDGGEDSDSDGGGEDAVEAYRRAREELQATKNAQAAWMDDTSDSLTLIRALSAYSTTDMPKHGFCVKHFLRAKTMLEITKLRKQLFTAVLASAKQQASGDTTDIRLAEEEAQARAFDAAAAAVSMVAFQDALTVPKAADARWLREVIIAASLDTVARRAPPEMAPDADAGKRQSTKGLVPYVACSRAVDTLLYIHPSSSVFSPVRSELPEYVVYQDIVVGKRAYMKGVTVVDAARLPVLANGTNSVRFGPPLDTPLPHYNKSRDMVMCCVRPVFGDRGWKLPPFHVPHPDKLQRFRWFARSLLEGAVLPELSGRKLLSPASGITKGAHSKRVQQLVAALSQRGVDCLEALTAVWQVQPRVLLKEVCAWMDEPHALKSDWKAIVTRAVAAL